MATSGDTIGDTAFEMRMGVFLERIWPPASAPKGWLSQIGGFPNLPPHIEWPSIVFADGREASLDFLAQIRLADLPDVPDRELLPQVGMLYFFAVALAAEPLDGLGSDAWRVIYWRGDAADIQPVAPPDDSARSLNDLYETRTPAADLHDCDARPRQLFPRCPVRPIAAPSWRKPASHPEQAAWWALADRWPGAPPPPTTFDYKPDQLPWRVEDALLQLHDARNKWGEGLVTFEEFVSTHFAHQLRKRDDRDAAVERAREGYDAWVARAKETTRALRELGRATLLSASDRERFRALMEEGASITKTLGDKPRSWPEAVTARISLATLLLDHPEIATTSPDEVAAAHPGHLTKHGYHGHRMLGLPYDVQSGEDGDDQIMLLQLGSDWYGPRFMWWDMGNLTFFIRRENLAELEFDEASAVIEGY